MENNQKLLALRESLLNLVIKMRGGRKRYVNVTGQRILAGIYTNSTKEVLTVYLSVTNNSNKTDYLNVIVDDEIVARVGGAKNITHTISFEVFPNDTYSLSRLNNWTIVRWTEFKV